VTPGKFLLFLRNDDELLAINGDKKVIFSIIPPCVIKGRKKDFGKVMGVFFKG
jgi:hypothetical protein